MRKIAVINQKGGSCKTTTVVNLAAALAEKKKKVVVIDLDAQANTTNWFGKIGKNKGIYNVFTENQNINSLLQDTEIKNVKIIPASSELINLEKVLDNKSLKTNLKNQLNYLEESSKDYLIIDCPPTLSSLTVNILAACNEIIIPIEGRTVAISSLIKFLEVVKIVKTRLNNDLKISGVLVCRVDSRNRHSKEMMDLMNQKFDKLIYQTFIRENVTLAEAAYAKKTVMQYDPECTGAQDYKALAKELINQEEAYFMNLAERPTIQQKNL